MPVERIKDIIPQVIDNLSSGRQETRTRVYRLWQNMSNKKILQHTVVAGLHKGELVIHVDSPAWLFQMNLQKRKILEKLKEEIPELSQIRFRIGKIL